MKRDQAEKIVRSIRRLCRGHPLLTEAERREYFLRWQRAERAGDFSLGLWLMHELEEKLKRSSRPIADQDWEGLLRQVASLISAHTEVCGYDFNDIVVAGLWDGKEHNYQCPRCCVAGSYRAPLFPPEADAPREHGNLERNF